MVTRNDLDYYDYVNGNGEYTISDEYSYDEILKKALDTDKFEDKDRLAKWIEDYDSADWNGESYKLGKGLYMYPEYKEVGDEEWEICDYRIERI